MTAMSVDRATSRLVAALEHAWTTIRRHHPDVPQAVIVIASAATPRSRCCVALPRSRRPRARSSAIASTVVGTAKPTAPCGLLPCAG